MISENMPSNSDAVPLLGTYFNCVMFMIASSVVSTIVVNVNIRPGGGSSQPKKVGSMVQKLLFNWLPKILRMEPFSVVNRNLKDSLEETSLSPRQKIYLTDKVTKGNFPQKLGLAHEDSDPSLKRKWMYAAVVVDRLCLAVSIIFIIISTVVLFVSTLW